MDKKIIAIVFLGAGVVLLLASATADYTGLGGAPGFGWKQMSGSLVGVVMVILGVLLGKQAGCSYCGDK